MLIKNKFNGYSSDGQRVYHCDSQPSAAGDTTVRNLSFPEQLQPYAEKLMGKTQELIDKPYATYDYDRLAQFDPMQLQAQQGAANLGPAKQLGLGTQMAGLAGARAGELSYDPTTFTNQYTAPAQYANTQFTYDKVDPSTQVGGTMVAPDSVTGFGGATKEAKTKSFIDPGTAASYMSPYTQNVTDIQTREAQRAADIEATKRGAQAVGAGAFGGSRQAIMEAEAARNLAQQKGDITARGQQSAYEQAMQQFNAEQGYGLTAQQANLQAGLQSALANQQSGLTVGQQNLAAQLQTQGLNAQQAMQAALANQQMGMSAQQAAEQSKQYGYGQQMTAAQQAAQYGLAAQQAQEQSKQFGANLGLQGIQQQLAAAGTMGQLGQTQFGQEKDVINAQAAAGAQRQALDQAKKDIDYGDFQRQQQYDYQQLGFMSDLLRGAPMGNMTTSLYAAPPSALSTAAGLATTGYGLSRAVGGVVQSDRGPAGLAELALQKTLGARKS